MDKELKEYLIETMPSKSLIEKCDEIDNIIKNQLNIKSFICPTARESVSIQFEYDQKNGTYLEFEILEIAFEYIIEYFFEYSDSSKFKGDYIDGKCSEKKMIEIIKNFYELDEISFGKYLKEIGGTKWTGC